MKIFERYIASSVLQSMALVLAVLLALFTFFAFLEEANHIGRGNYDFRHALSYILLTVPGLISQLLPMTALLGCVLGLGLMASNSELIALRSAGISLSRIVWVVMKVGIVLVIAGLVLSELIAPATDRYAKTLRSVAISKQISMEGKEGLWARDGDDIVNVRKFLPGERLGEIYIYHVNARHELSELKYARTASHRSGNWVMEGVRVTEITENGATASRFPELAWPTALSPDLINVVTVEPRTLSVVGLFQYIQYLDKNSLSAESYQQAFWSKVMAPFVTCIMMLLAVPFVFGSLRSVGVGSRLLGGTLIGIGFHLLTQMSSYMGLVFHLNAVFSAVAPAVLALTVAVIMLRRVY